MRTANFDYPRFDGQFESNTACKTVSINQFADMVLDVGTLLLESGAHCERINRNVQRMAQNTNFEVEVFLSFTTVSISVIDKNNPESSITKNRRIKHHGAHFGVVTDTSLLTWELADNKLDLVHINDRIEKLKNTEKHPKWITRLFIGVACGCLCLLAGGDLVDGFFAFTASIIGLVTRQIMVVKGFNVMVAVLCSAFVTTTISGMNALYGLGQFPDSSVATSVLFLIPGVPLINSIIDLLEGYIPIGMARGAFGGFILLCLAVGMFISMSLIGLNNF